jgi:hypothetical protein
MTNSLFSRSLISAVQLAAQEFAKDSAQSASQQ